MQQIKVVTDSTLDLASETIEKYHIHIVPLSITIDGESYIDGVDLSPDEFIKKMKEAKELPKTSQPSIGSFVELYDQLGKDGSEIISIHMTGGMSGTIRSAESAAQISQSKVTVVDSQFISQALSFQVVEAAKLASQGKAMSEILVRLEEIRKNSYLYIMVDTLENLVKGGRIGRGKALVGSLLKIKPVASLADGVYTPITKVRSYSQLIKFLTEQFLQDTLHKTVKTIGISHADNLDLAQSLKEAISKVANIKDISIHDTTPVISTHTGPGAIALMYHAE